MAGKWMGIRTIWVFIAYCAMLALGCAPPGEAAGLVTRDLTAAGGRYAASVSGCGVDIAARSPAGALAGRGVHVETTSIRRDTSLFETGGCTLADSRAEDNGAVAIARGAVIERFTATE